MFDIGHYIWINMKEKGIGIMVCEPEVTAAVFIFHPTTGKLKALDIAFDWIRPTLNMAPDITHEMGDVSEIDSFINSWRPNFLSSMYVGRTSVYKEMLNLIHTGINPRTEDFINEFFNAYENHSDFVFLIKIIFTLVDHDDITLESVIDACSKIQNKSALIIILQEADARRNKLKKIERFEL